MVGTIVPIVHGEREAHRMILADLAHTAGLVIAGMAVGYLLSAGLDAAGLRLALEEKGLAMAVLSGTFALGDTRLVRVPMPQLQRQVPAAWRGQYPPRVAALLYGLALGPGLLTHIRTGAYYVLLALVALLQEPVIGSAMLGAYGLWRGLPVIYFGRKHMDIERTFHTNHALAPWEPMFGVLSGLLLAFAFGYFLAWIA